MKKIVIAKIRTLFDPYFGRDIFSTCDFRERNMVERYYSEERKEFMSFRLWYFASDETWNIFSDSKRY